MSSLLLAKNRSTVNKNPPNPHDYFYTLVNRSPQKAIDLSQKISSLKNTTVTIGELSQLNLSKYPTLFLGIKPTQLKDLILQNPTLKTYSGEIVSTLAAIPLQTLKNVFPQAKIYTRIMPSITAEEFPSHALFLSSHSSETVLNSWYNSSLGSLIPVADDKQLDHFTVIFGSNAAYVAALLKPWIDFLVKNNLFAPNTSQDMLLQQIITACQYLKNKNFSDVINRVKTPGGITAETLRLLDEKNYADTIHQALEASSQRSQEISLQVSRDLNSSTLHQS